MKKPVMEVVIVFNKPPTISDLMVLLDNIRGFMKEDPNILGVKKINGEPVLLIELKFALPKFIEKVWHQIKPQIKKRKPNYLKFMESKGYLYPL